MTDVETETFTIESDAGDTDELTIPSKLIEIFSEGDESSVQVVTDITMLAFAGRAHAVVHHEQGEVDEELQAIEDKAMDLFEERFGVSYAEATGHHH